MEEVKYDDQIQEIIKVNEELRRENELLKSQIFDKTIKGRIITGTKQNNQ